ncbi:MAG: UbiA-like protein EboC [Cytophagales bacterium]|nr:UbiA-like protein EboC [Cytophagales bacterium]
MSDGRPNPYLVLVRPANVVTAIADIFAGIALSGALVSNFFNDHIWSGLALVLTTACLYAGGIVFNDVFDFELDKKERPERPLPSGQITKEKAAWFGLTLFIIALSASAQVSTISAMLAIGIIICATSYDKYFKQTLVGGPLVMGMCRGLNLLLGVSIIQGQVFELWWISGLPVLFIAAITLTSKGEVHGNNRYSVMLALGFDLIVAGAIIFLAYQGYFQLLMVLPFLLIWLLMNLRAKGKAIIENTPGNVMKAVKMGVISLIPLNACYAAGSSYWWFGLITLLLLPLSLLLSRKFAVT